MSSEQATTWRGANAAMIEGLVVQAVAEALGVPADAVLAAPALFDVPGFDSLTVVTILARLEDELGAEIPPDAIVPEAFESLGALAALFEANLAAAPCGARGAGAAGAAPVPCSGGQE